MGSKRFQPDGTTALLFVLFTLLGVILIVAGLFNMAQDMFSQTLLSAVSFAWFSIAWPHIYSAHSAHPLWRRLGIVATFFATIFFLVITWTKHEPLAFALIRPTAFWYTLSYTSAHTAYFLNLRPFKNILLKTIGAAALLCIGIVSILLVVLIFNNGNIASTFFYRLLFTFMLFNAASTFCFSILKKRIT